MGVNYPTATLNARWWQWHLGADLIDFYWTSTFLATFKLTTKDWNKNLEPASDSYVSCFQFLILCFLIKSVLMPTGNIMKILKTQCEQQINLLKFIHLTVLILLTLQSANFWLTFQVQIVNKYTQIVGVLWYILLRVLCCDLYSECLKKDSNSMHWRVNEAATFKSFIWAIYSSWDCNRVRTTKWLQIAPSKGLTLLGR